MRNVGEAFSRIDRFCDYVPVVSFVSNITDLFIKCFVLRHKSKIDFKASPYLSHLQQKSTGRCLAAAIPILGNVGSCLYDIIYHRTYDNADWLMGIAKAHGKVSGQPEILKKASGRIKRDPAFFLREDVPAHLVKYADEELRTNKRFIKKFLKAKGYEHVSSLNLSDTLIIELINEKFGGSKFLAALLTGHPSSTSYWLKRLKPHFEEHKKDLLKLIKKNTDFLQKFLTEYKIDESKDLVEHIIKNCTELLTVNHVKSILIKGYQYVLDHDINKLFLEEFKNKKLKKEVAEFFVKSGLPCMEYIKIDPSLAAAIEYPNRPLYPDERERYERQVAHNKEFIKEVMKEAPEAVLYMDNRFITADHLIHYCSKDLSSEEEGKIAEKIADFLRAADRSGSSRFERRDIITDFLKKLTDSSKDASLAVKIFGLLKSDDMFLFRHDLTRDTPAKVLEGPGVLDALTAAERRI